MRVRSMLRTLWPGGRRHRSGRTAVLGALALSACASVPVATTDHRPPVTLLLSIDGFSPDNLHHGDTPTLDALAAGGVQGRMRPPFPSVTFPSHEAMITGLYPDHSGIVANTMSDPRRPGVTFTTRDAAQVSDPFWWDDAEPLWITAEKARIRTGILFWPGADVAHDGLRPSDWAHYDANFHTDDRIRTVLDWMRRPADIRPKFVGLYVDSVDKNGHRYGPHAPETIAAVRETDAQIGMLVRGLAALGQPANLVIVSDHGMRDVDPARTLLLPSILPDGAYRLGQWGPFASIDPMPGHAAQVAAALLAPHPHAHCWRKADLPARFQYGTHPRVGAFICLAAPGGEIGPVLPTSKGDHGYDPEDPAMAALFLVTGPAFRKGAPAPPPFDNVDIYSLVRALIGLPPATAIDGTIAPFRPLLAH